MLLYFMPTCFGMVWCLLCLPNRTVLSCHLASSQELNCNAFQTKIQNEHIKKDLNRHHSKAKYILSGYVYYATRVIIIEVKYCYELTSKFVLSLIKKDICCFGGDLWLYRLTNALMLCSNCRQKSPKWFIFQWFTFWACECWFGLLSFSMWS